MLQFSGRSKVLGEEGTKEEILGQHSAASVLTRAPAQQQAGSRALAGTRPPCRCFLLEIEWLQNLLDSKGCLSVMPQRTLQNRCLLLQ